MARISVGEAAGAGFKVIGANPVAAFLVWTLTYLIISAVPFLIIGGMIAGDVQSFGDADPDQIVAFANKIQMIQPLMMLASIVVMAVIYNAIFRAVLKPEDKGFFYMKLGGEEFWQGLVQLCLSILLGLITFAIILAGAAVGGIVFFIGQAAGSPSAGWIQAIGIGLVILACVVAIVWIALRLSLAGPATLHKGQFELFESWTLTKGHTGQLFLVALVVGLIVTVLYGVLIGISQAVIPASYMVGFREALATPGASGSDVPAWAMWVLNLLPALLVGSIFSVLLVGPIYAITMAPWASAYRQITFSTDVAQEF